MKFALKPLSTHLFNWIKVISKLPIKQKIIYGSAALLVLVIIGSFTLKAQNTPLSVAGLKIGKTKLDKPEVNGKVAGDATNQNNSENGNNSGNSSDKKNSSATNQKSSDNKNKTTTDNSTSTSSQTVTPSTTRRLYFDPATVVMTASSYAYVHVTAESNTQIKMPLIVSADGVYAQIQSDVLGRDLALSWNLLLGKTSMTDTGEGYVTIKALDEKGNKYEGRVLVKRVYTPYFYVTKGPVTTAVAGDYATATFNFILQPGPGFGSPVIRATLAANPVCDLAHGSITNRVFSYSGQNDYSLVCVLPLSTARQSGFNVTITVRGDNVLEGGTLNYNIPPNF